MTQTAKKTSDTYSEKKHQDSEISTVHAMREGVENFKRTADDINHKAAAGIGMCSEKMGAFVNSGAAASRCCMNVSNEIMECCNRTASELSEISQEALACRTVSEVMDLQTRSLEQLSSSYLEIANKISRLAFDAWAEAISPVVRRTDSASKPMRKAA